MPAQHLTDLVWLCLHGDPPCRPSDRCSDGCRPVTPDEHDAHQTRTGRDR